eukprot:4229338-Amphidinium_carterae.2
MAMALKQVQRTLKQQQFKIPITFFPIMVLQGDHHASIPSLCMSKLVQWLASNLTGAARWISIKQCNNVNESLSGCERVQKTSGI